jgi:hypothetical protein
MSSAPAKDKCLTTSQLEHLENVFYKEALQKFDQAAFEAAGFDAHFFQNMLFIVQDEEKHVQLLSGALTAAGAKPVEACKYNFGVTDMYVHDSAGQLEYQANYRQ